MSLWVWDVLLLYIASYLRDLSEKQKMYSQSNHGTIVSPCLSLGDHMITQSSASGSRSSVSGHVLDRTRVLRWWWRMWQRRLLDAWLGSDRKGKQIHRHRPREIGRKLVCICIKLQHTFWKYKLKDTRNLQDWCFKDGLNGLHAFTSLKVYMMCDIILCRGECIFRFESFRKLENPIFDSLKSQMELFNYL